MFKMTVNAFFCLFDNKVDLIYILKFCPCKNITLFWGGRGAEGEDKTINIAIKVIQMLKARMQTSIKVFSITSFKNAKNKYFF